MSYYLGVFFLVYFVQGSSHAYFINFQKVFLLNEDIANEKIALLGSLIFLPFILKIIFAYAADHLGSKIKAPRTRLIQLGLTMAMGGFALAALVPPSQNFLAFAIALMVSAFGMALYDTSTDGLAIVVTPEGKHNSVQAAMVSGRAMGFMCMALGLGTLANIYGYSIVFWTLATLAFFALIFTFKIQEPTPPNKAKTSLRAEFYFIRQKPYIFFMIYIILHTCFSFGSDGMMAFYLGKIRGFNPQQLGQYGSMRGAGSIIGALTTAYLLNYYSWPKTAVFAITLAATACFLAPLGLNQEKLYLFAIPWGFAWAFSEIIFLTIAMRLCPKNLAATSFSFFMMLGNLGASLGEGGATRLGESLGFEKVFYLLSLLAITSLGFLLCTLHLKKSSTSV